MSLLKRILSPSFLFPVLIFALLAGALSYAVTSSAKGYEKERLAVAERALHKAVVACYAIEGMYPPSIEYMREHYGLAIDDELYFVHYEYAGGNMMPDARVFAKLR